MWKTLRTVVLKYFKFILNKISDKNFQFGEIIRKLHRRGVPFSQNRNLYIF